MKRTATIVSLSAALLFSAPWRASSAPLVFDSGAFTLVLGSLHRTEFWGGNQLGTPNAVFFSGYSLELDRAFVPTLLQVGEGDRPEPCL